MTKNFKIKVLVMDVDGTLTDGGIYIGKEGEIFKKFHRSEERRVGKECRL